jgi:molybdopterin-guanine dinucleotide biosynthesis protein A
MSAAPVHGLVLAGGASSRMQRDKALLLYEGKSQLDRAFELLARHVPKVFVSVRADQAAEPARARRPLIVDSVEGGGPIVGIRSALAAHSGAAWLVLACDLPFLSDDVLERLLVERDPACLATAYASAHDGLPEPLCAIWEPAALPELAAFQSSGGQCPRKFLKTRPIRLLQPGDPRALDNVNTPEEYRNAAHALQSPGAAGGSRPAAGPLTLRIQYFAVMREQAGRSEESVTTMAGDPCELYQELRARHGFTLPREQLKVAVNGEFSEWTRRLGAGDAVVFIPPVAGG